MKRICDVWCQTKGGQRDCTIRRWWLIDGEQPLVLRGHTNMVASLCLFHDDSHLVSASRDCSIRVWDIQTN
ncbi:hypothetical protein M405DRAFT_749691 [Rhizopogon salebrosus TDB-379]|nr:hypothetical protein M405DRAFT_749691 [Rhizopogon salebrosus TDB-379]